MEGCLAMAGVGFLQSLWEKPIWESVRSCLDPMDSVCLRTASVEWNVAGKYGPHGELIFLLIQKEPATEQVGETFSPFFNADIRTTLFSADVLKKCALIALHLIAEEGRDGDGCHVLGRRISREGNVCNDALHVIGLCGPGDKISQFLQDWELAKVALSCHMALDMLCQEMNN